MARLKTVVKLKSVLQNQLSLLARPLIFAGLLFLVWLWNFNILSVAIFLAGNFLFYIYPLMNSMVFISSFVIIITLSLSSLYLSVNHFLGALAVIIGYSILFFLILGLKNLRLISTNYWYYLINLGLFFGVFLNFFIRINEQFLIKLILLFLASFFLFREYLKIFSKKVSKENNLLAFFISFLISQLAWIVSWLPIGPIAASNMLFVFVYSVENLILLKAEGKLKDKKAIIKNALIFCLLLVFIIFTSQWQMSF